jgi:hypothetical protein
MKTFVFNEGWSNIPAGAEISFAEDDARVAELLEAGTIRELTDPAPAVIVTGDVEASAILEQAGKDTKAAQDELTVLQTKFDALVNAHAQLETALAAEKTQTLEANNRAEENRKLAMQFEGERDLAVTRGNELLAAITPEKLGAIKGVKPEVAQAIFEAIIKTKE